MTTKTSTDPISMKLDDAIERIAALSRSSPQYLRIAELGEVSILLRQAMQMRSEEYLDGLVSGPSCGLEWKTLPRTVVETMEELAGALENVLLHIRQLPLSSDKNEVVGLAREALNNYREQWRKDDDETVRKVVGDLHFKVLHGKCPICGHFGDDCTGKLVSGHFIDEKSRRMDAALDNIVTAFVPRQVRHEDAPPYLSSGRAGPKDTAVQMERITGEYDSGPELVAKAISYLAAKHVPGKQITTTNETKDYLRLLLAEREEEEFWMLLLDNRNRVLGQHVVSTGTLNGCAVYPREVVKVALRYNAAAVILCHNHPSGMAEPSRADEVLTQRLKEALSLIDVRILDHVVVGTEGTVSFSDRGLL